MVNLRGSEGCETDAAPVPPTATTVGQGFPGCARTRLKYFADDSPACSLLYSASRDPLSRGTVSLLAQTVTAGGGSVTSASLPHLARCTTLKWLLLRLSTPTVIVGAGMSAN